MISQDWVRRVTAGLGHCYGILDSMLGGLATFLFISIYIYIENREKRPNLTHPLTQTCS